MSIRRRFSHKPRPSTAPIIVPKVVSITFHQLKNRVNDPMKLSLKKFGFHTWVACNAWPSGKPSAPPRIPHNARFLARTSSFAKVEYRMPVTSAHHSPPQISGRCFSSTPGSQFQWSEKYSSGRRLFAGSCGELNSHHPATTAVNMPMTSRSISKGR